MGISSRLWGSIERNWAGKRDDTLRNSFVHYKNCEILNALSFWIFRKRKQGLVDDTDAGLGWQLLYSTAHFAKAYVPLLVGLAKLRYNDLILDFFGNKLRRGHFN